MRGCKSLRRTFHLPQAQCVRPRHQPDDLLPGMLFQQRPDQGKFVRAGGLDHGRPATFLYFFHRRTVGCDVVLIQIHLHKIPSPCTGTSRPSNADFARRFGVLPECPPER